MSFKTLIPVSIVSMMLSTTAIANSALEFQTEITPRVLNGNTISDDDLLSKNKLKLDVGENQLAVTIGQLVFEDGKRRKFDSQPYLLTFSVGDDQFISMTYPTFRTIDDAKKFEKSPGFDFVDNSGSKVSHELIQMNKGGLQGFRDYEREVADYNAQFSVVPVTLPEIESPKKQTKPVVRPSTLQADFLAMTPEQRQEFVSWAVKNLNN